MEGGWEGGRVELDETSTDKGFSITEKQKTATKRAEKKSMSVIRTTNKTRRQQNIKWGIYNGYILATSASQTLACYKISWQYGLLFRRSCSQPTHSSRRHSRSPFLLLLGYTVPRSGLFKPTPDLTPKASLSRSWNSLAIKTRAVGERERERRLCRLLHFMCIYFFIFHLFIKTQQHSTVLMLLKHSFSIQT